MYRLLLLLLILLSGCQGTASLVAEKQWVADQRSAFDGTAARLELRTAW